MNKKITVLFAVLVAASMILAACQPTEVIKEVEVPVEVVKEVEVPVEVEVEVPVPSKTLVFSSRLFSPPREQEYFINEIIKPFEEEHGVTVNFQIIDDQTLLDRAEVQQTTDHVTTDIVVAHNSRMPEWIEAGWVEDLTDVVAGWDDRTFSAAFESRHQ